MNWKIILGILIILGAVLELNGIADGTNPDGSKFDPKPMQVMGLAMVGFGVFLIYLGRRDKKKRIS